MQVSLGIALGTAFRDHFPERLEAFILINPPILFKVLLGALGAIADARTMSKLQTVVAPTPRDACATLRERFGIEDEAVQAWLLEAFSTPPVPGTLPVPPEPVRATLV